MFVAVPAGARRGWLAPVNVSAPGRAAFHPEIAVDAQGSAIAVWERGNESTAIIQASVRPAGGKWQKPVSLSGGGEQAGGAQVAFDERGDAIAIWGRGPNEFTGVVQAAVRPAGGSWHKPVNVSAPGGVATRTRARGQPAGRGHRGLESP